MAREYPTPRSLLDFLQVLLRTTEQNINFICNMETHRVYELEKYKNEIEQIQKLINSFTFEVHETPNSIKKNELILNKPIG